MTVSVKQTESKDFSGDLTCVSLLELLIKLEADGHTGHLEVVTPSYSGFVWFEAGVLWDAAADSLQGLAAFYRLASAKQGRFSVRTRVVSRGQMIHHSVRLALDRRVCLEADWSGLPGGVVDLEQIVVPRDRLRARLAQASTPEQRGLMQLVDGQRSVVEIVECRGGDVVANIRTLTSWAARGWVTVTQPVRTLQPAPPRAERTNLADDRNTFVDQASLAPVTQRVPRSAAASLGSTVRGLQDPLAASRPQSSGSKPAELSRQTRVLFPVIPVTVRASAPDDASEPPATLRGLPAPIDVEGSDIELSDAKQAASATGLPHGQTPRAVRPVRVARTTLVISPHKEAKSNPELAPPASEPLAPYAELGPYQVVSRLGRGAMGAVYLARLRAEVGPERQFAIKVLRTKFHKNDQALSMLINEARIASQVQHPNVVGVFDVGSLRGQPYLVMEYVCGCTLDRLLAEGAGSASTSRIVRIVLDCLTGLRAIHDARDPTGVSLGVVHNDLSPRNVLVGIDGISRLTDFGVAQVNTPLGVNDSHAFGTRAFLAPERLKGASGDARSDVFSLGVLLWKGLTGLPLFEAESFDQTTANVLGKPIAPPSSVGRHSPPHLDALCMRALARDPNARYQSAEQMRRELEAIAKDSGLLADHESVATWVRELFGAPSYPEHPIPKAAQQSHVAPSFLSREAPRHDSRDIGAGRQAMVPFGAGASGRGTTAAADAPVGVRFPTVVLKRQMPSRSPTRAKWAAVVVAIAALLFAVIGPELLDYWGGRTEQGVRSLRPAESVGQGAAP